MPAWRPVMSNETQVSSRSRCAGESARHLDDRPPAWTRHLPILQLIDAEQGAAGEHPHGQSVAEHIYFRNRREAVSVPKASPTQAAVGAVADPAATFVAASRIDVPRSRRRVRGDAAAIRLSGGAR